MRHCHRNGCDMIRGMGWFDDVPASDWELSAADSLFNRGEDWRLHSVQLHRDTIGFPFSLGFHQAADMLVNRQVEQGRAVGYLAFPALFLYRQALELSLKEVIYDGPQPPAVVKSHDLRQLWAMALPVIESVGPDDGMRGHVKRIIEELADVDPDSQHTRYDRNNKGEGRTLPDELMRLDLSNVKTVIGKVVAYLSNVGEVIDAYRRDMT